MKKLLTIILAGFTMASCTVNSGNDSGGGTGSGGSTWNWGAYNTCYGDGLTDGYSDGYDDGYFDGYYGYSHECSVGYDDGYDDGYDGGYDDGWYDGDYDWFNGFSSNTFETTNSGSRDLESIGGMIEAVQKQKVETALYAKYGLSEDRAKELSGILLYTHNKAKTRNLTREDLDLFAKQVSGMNFKTAQKALTEATTNAETYDDLINKVATFNQANPENIKGLISDLMLEQSPEEFINNL